MSPLGRHAAHTSTVYGAPVGTVVWLVGLNPGVLEVVRHAGLDKHLGRERMLFNAREAIERYLALQASTGGVQPAATP